MNDMSKLNLYQRINEIRKKVDYIQKDKSVSTGTSGSYKAVTHDQVTAILRSHMTEFGVICVPSLVTSKANDRVGDSKQFRYDATYSFDFINMDKPEEKSTIIMEAHAMDNADKAPGKALSYAKKYAVLKLFEIETGEDEESRYAPEEPTTPYPEYETDVIRIKEISTIKDLSLLWNKMDGKQKFYLEVIKEEQKNVLANKEAKEPKKAGE
jgi:ERF superfamily